MADPRETPAMQQYYRFKKQHPECVLLFRIGDFYEMFDDDAVRVSKSIGLTLTQRTAGIPMAGIPFHQLDAYLRKLLRAGFRVAVCDQLEDSSKAKGIVQRGVTRVITPGTLVDETLLESESPATLGAIVFTESGDESAASLAVVDLATGSFCVVDCAPSAIVDELARRGVRELLYCETGDGVIPPRVQKHVAALNLSPTARPGWHFRATEARQALTEQFGVSTLSGFGMTEGEGVVLAAGVLVRYLRETQSGADASGTTKRILAHLRAPRREQSAGACVIDAVSLRSLEIERTIRGGTLDGSLLGLFVSGRDACKTAMGKRTLREWLMRPLMNIDEINARQTAVAALFEDGALSGHLAELLSKVQDIARIAGRIALNRATPRDMLALAKSLSVAEELGDAIGRTPSLASVADRINEHAESLGDLGRSILERITEQPPAHLREGGVIRDGADATLDEARLLQRDAGSWLAQYQTRLIEQHNLPSLKVGFNKIFGYYIELPAGQARNAPAELIRKQTLKNAERYMTPELREFEHKVLSAESTAIEREKELFAELCAVAGARVDDLLSYAAAIASLDAMCAFADRARSHGWVRPTITDRKELHIVAGRHPVLEETLAGEFVPNDVNLGAGEENSAPLALITGPNMAGKSTYIRQVALLVILAQTGSFVPAESAVVGVTDRIFTRIGADDALHAGQSTFMVEMIETANILNHATERSLVVLDEVGRGTSTLDGLSLAWAIVEFLSTVGARTLFATHYHELTSLEEQMQGKIRNLHVAVREWPPGDPHAQIIFLHRIEPGRTDRSYGLHVAKLAGIPARVINRGREVLASLAVHQEGATPPPAAASTAARQHDEAGQLSLFTEYLPHPAIDRLREIKLENLTPMQAFDVLRSLGELARES